ncbi:MAG: hypothetical protein MJZ71_04070 [Bacteroidales bacterium]|nr:hypothetical protein [Bacteroidales bacterium]
MSKKEHSKISIYRLVSKNLGFIIYCCALLIVLISLRYGIEGSVRKINKLSSEISELQEKSREEKTKYQTATKMSSVDARLESTGVSISKEPIKDIIIYEDPR